MARARVTGLCFRVGVFEQEKIRKAGVREALSLVLLTERTHFLG